MEGIDFITEVFSKIISPRTIHKKWDEKIVKGCGRFQIIDFRLQFGKPKDIFFILEYIEKAGCYIIIHLTGI